MFSIDAAESVRSADSPTARGRIVVGDFSEFFQMDLAFWTIDQYRASWRRALEVLSEGDAEASCLISSITDPKASNFVSCWPIYRDGDDVRVQNAVIFLENLTDAFDPARPWLSVRPHASLDEDGNKISEWLTDMTQIRGCLQAMKTGPTLS